MNKVWLEERKPETPPVPFICTDEQIEKATTGELIPVQVQAFACYLELEKVVTKALSSSDWIKADVTGLEFGKLPNGKYVDTQNRGIGFIHQPYWMVVAPTYRGWYMDHGGSIIYSNIENKSTLDELVKRYAKVDKDHYRIMKSVFHVHGLRGLYYNQQYRFIRKRINKADFEKLIPIFKTPEATIYTDLEDLKKNAEKFVSMKGCWALQHPEALSLYIRSDDHNVFNLIINEEVMDMTFEGPKILNHGFNKFWEEVLGREMNHLEKEMIGLLFSKPFLTNKTVESELLLDTPPQFEEEDKNDFDEFKRLIRYEY